MVNEPATATCPAPCTALYAGTVTSGAIFETSSILRSQDGVTWNPLPQASGTFLGNLSIAGDPVTCPTCPGSDQTYQNYGIRSGGQLNGVLYLQVGDFAGVGRVIGSLPGSNPSLGGNDYHQR